MKQLFLKRLLALSILLVVASSVRALNIYVSPTGHDTNSGAQNAPLASMEGARALIASSGLAGKEPVTVWVQGGTYHLAQPFHLGPKDSGTEPAPITYRAVPGEEVVLKGSLPLDSKAWKPRKNGIYLQSLKGTALAGRDFNQVFMDDTRMVRARYPNLDYDNPLRSGKGYLTCAGGSRTELDWKPGDLDSRKDLWKNPQTGIVHAFQKNNWGNMQFRIKDMDWANRKILFGEGGWQMQRRLGVGLHGKTASQYNIENIFEELDAPFEWFLDTTTQTLYFMPPPGVNLRDVKVEAATVSRIIECVGVEHVHFEGFHLTQTRATFMDKYCDLARGDWAIHRGGSVYFLDCQNCSVKNFHIEQVGGNGIFVDGFNREVHISGCLVENIGDSAVCFVGDPKAVRDYQTWEEPVKITDLAPGPKTKDYPAECGVSNSIMRDVGVYGKQTAGVIISMSMDVTVSHCSIYRTPRAGVNINDGTWGGHIVEDCDIYDTVRETGEHGPVNSWGRERYWNGNNLDKKMVLLDAIKPVIFCHNRVGNYRAGVSAGNWTIDLDDGSSSFKIYDNLMLGSTLKLRDGYFRKVWNNIMVSAVPIGIHVWPKDNSDDVFERNIVVVAGAVEGSGITSTNVIGSVIMPDDYGLWGRFDSNVWWNTNAKDFSTGSQITSLARWQEKQGLHDIFADPMFRDPANRDFRVKANSPAFKLGFKNFPMDTFGHEMTRVMGGDQEFVGEINVVIRPDARGGDVRFTLDGSTPNKNSPLYSEPLKVRKTTAIRALAFDPQGNAVGFPDTATLTKVDEVRRQSWLASLLADRSVEPDAAASSSPESKPMEWAGLELVTISDFPDYIDASGGQSFGAFVVKLNARSPAARAGFKNGDTIIQAGSTVVHNLDDLKNALKSATGPVTCMVFRGYQHYNFTMTP